MDGLLPTSVGSTTWPGLAKLAEECGENVQVVAMLIAFPDGDRPDGSGVNVVDRLHDELGDLQAAIDYVVWANDLDAERIAGRRAAKASKFLSWHERERGFF